MSIVELQSIKKSYGSVQALAGVDLKIKEGEFLTLLGPSGSGKTTILQLIAGMIHPTAGRIVVDGLDVTDLPPGERNLGMVFQNYALMPHMTIFDNIAFPLKIRSVSRNEIRSRVEEVLSLIKLPDIGSRFPRELSGGQQQRVALARCIVYKPKLILMDEPLGALDKKLREAIQIEIKQIHAQLGATILYVTHDQEEALTMSDRIVLMCDGKIEQDSEPSEMYFNPCSVFAADFIGSSNLIDGQVTGVGDVVTVDTAAGKMLVKPGKLIVKPATQVTCLIRPENIRLEDGGAGSVNSFAGTYVDCVIVGSVIKHFIQLSGNIQLTAMEFNSARRRIYEKGQPLTAIWDAEGVSLLPMSAH